MRTSLKRVTAALAAVLLWVCAAPSALGAVYTEETGGGPADSVYVAGTPDCYPIEYFDEDSGTYCGLIPDLLNEVSEKTGISFTYISAGSEDRRQSLYENRQVELVTAVTAEDAGFDGLETAVVLTAEQNGETTAYCIGFTELLTQTRRAHLLRALAEITDAQKAGWLLAHAEEAPSLSHRQLVILAVAAAVIVLAAAVTVLLLRRRKRRNALDRLVDDRTGVGNGDYYTYAFDRLISPQARSLYALAYLAFDVRQLQEQRRDVSVAEIEKYAAAKLAKCHSAAEYLSRISDGTFVLLFQAENREAAQQRLQELTEGVNGYIAELVRGSGELFRAGCCRLCDNVGIDAETAVYHARQGYLYAVSKGLLYHIGSNAQLAAGKKAQRLAEQLDDALAGDEFKVYVQFFSDGKTERFCGGEVLSRWQNSEYGLLRPDEYIGVLSRTGKIVEHDYRIFEKVCAILEKWSAPPFDTLFLSCNFTRLSVSDPSFAGRLAEISDKYRFARHRLVVEITESSLSVSSEAVSENIRQLTKLGFQVAIDDMGTGFSSLADIYDNEVDIVKIERDFVASCVTARRREMLRGLISMIHHAGARVICEGVETAEQLAMLKALDCDMMQGFYHSRVLPFSECERFFLSHQPE